MLLGTAQIGLRQTRTYWARLLQTAADTGFGGFDTAPMYGDGTAERMVGRVTAGRPLSFQTKVGLRRRVPYGFLPRPLALTAAAPLHLAGWSDRTHPVLDPRAVERQRRASLRRLGRPYVHTLLLHEPQPELVSPPLVQLLDDVRGSGEAQHVGLAGRWRDVRALLLRYPSTFTVIQLPAVDLRAALADSMSAPMEVRVHGLVGWVASTESRAPATAVPHRCLAALREVSGAAWPRVTPIISTRSPERIEAWAHAWNDLAPERVRP